MKGWRGTITRTPSLDTLLDVSLNGDNLRARAASCQIELAARDVAKSSAQVDALVRQIQVSPKEAANELWILGLLARTWWTPFITTPLPTSASAAPAAASLTAACSRGQSRC